MIKEHTQVTFRHRHRIQGRHLLSASMPSTLDNRKGSGNPYLRPTVTDPNTGLVSTPNNNDILPAVGTYKYTEIVFF